ncbi:MAG: luciferase family protein [Geminicoccaceae bacterium]
MPELTAELLRRVEDLPDVDVRDTVVSLPGAKGFWLADELPLKRPDVIVGGREFAHIHPDGSLHASLNPDTATVAIDTGWAVAHPWADQRPGWDGFVMIYTPQSADELEIVFELVLDSYNFVTGRTVSGE